jgi:hypothetical protein
MAEINIGPKPGLHRPDYYAAPFSVDQFPGHFPRFRVAGKRLRFSAGSAINGLAWLRGSVFLFHLRGARRMAVGPAQNEVSTKRRTRKQSWSRPRIASSTGRQFCHWPPGLELPGHQQDFIESVTRLEAKGRERFALRLSPPSNSVTANRVFKVTLVGHLTRSRRTTASARLSSGAVGCVSCTVATSSRATAGGSTCSSGFTGGVEAS